MATWRMDGPAASRHARAYSLLSGFTLLLVLAALLVPEYGARVTLRHLQFDLLQNLKPASGEGAAVAIVDIDEESLARLGQWPWPRRRVAQLLHAVASSRPAAIGLNVVFAEPDRMSADSILSSFPRLDDALRRGIEGLPSNDALLGGLLGKVPAVLGMTASEATKNTDKSALATPPSIAWPEGAATGNLPGAPGVLMSIPVVREKVPGAGLLSVLPEVDGVVRRMPTLWHIEPAVLPAFALELLRIALRSKTLSPEFDADGLTGIAIKDHFVPTARDGTIWLRFAPTQRERYISAISLLDGSVDRGVLENRLVLIGSTAFGLGETLATPVDAAMPGVEAHAQMAEAMLTGDYLERPSDLRLVEIALFLASGALIVLVSALGRFVLATGLVALVLTATMTGSWYAFEAHAVLHDSTDILLSAGPLFMATLAPHLLFASFERKRLQGDLERQQAETRRLEAELDAAREIQMQLIPRQFPAFPSRNEFEIYAMLEPAREVGGDLYDFELIDDNHLFFMVGDVSGKGLQAALFMAVTKALFRSSVMRRKRDMDRIMSEAGDELVSENPASLFVTVLAGILDLRTGVVEWCNAGNHEPYRLRAGGPPRKLEMLGGPPLCVMEGFPYPKESETLEPGDALVLYTDGIPEANDVVQQLYGEESAERLLAMTAEPYSAAGITRELFDDVDRFSAGTHQFDDITVLAVVYHGPSGGGA